jgi:hypothetical protein
VDGLDSTTGIVALAAAGVALVALIVALSLALRLRRLRASQRVLLGDRGEEDLIERAAATELRVSELQDGIEEIADALAGRLEDAERRLERAVMHTAVLRYDAFNETSGRQSSSIALLDPRGNGLVLSAILQREQARVYAKPVSGGHSPLELSPEEQEAMERALRRDGGGETR